MSLAEQGYYYPLSQEEEFERAEEEFECVKEHYLSFYSWRSKIKT